MILASGAPAGLSVHNVLRGRVTRIEAGGDGRVAVVQLAVGAAQILAEVTSDAITRLGVVPGGELHALVKSVSLQVIAASAEGPR